MKAPIIGLLSLLLGLAMPAYANDDGNFTGLIEPGRWEVTVQFYRNGQAIGDLPPERLCLTSKDITHYKEFMSKGSPPGGKVTMRTFERHGKRLHMHVVVDTNSGGETTKDLFYLFKSPTSYQGHGKNIGFDKGGHKTSIETKLEAHRIGDCTSTTAPADK